jgi:hypothetical protein
MKTPYPPLSSQVQAGVMRYEEIAPDQEALAKLVDAMESAWAAV